MKKLTLFLIIFILISINLSAVPDSSRWNGLADAVKRYIKYNSHNPQSLKIQSCTVIGEWTHPKKDSLWVQGVTYRTKNAYNAYVLEKKYFLMKGNRDRATVIISGTYQDISFRLNSAGYKLRYTYEGTKRNAI